jgi:hypothetical protein
MKTLIALPLALALSACTQSEIERQQEVLKTIERHTCYSKAGVAAEAELARVCKDKKPLACPEAIFILDALAADLVKCDDE